MKALNAQLEGLNPGNSFNEVSEHAGGTKAMEAEVWLGAFNYLDLEDFLERVRLTDFEYPDDVRILVQEQDDDHFRLVELSKNAPKDSSGEFSDEMDA
jgi:hypothetical protein